MCTGFLILLLISLISVISTDFCDFYWFLWFLLISLISPISIDFSRFPFDFFDFSEFILISLISLISSWFLLISKNMYVISHSDLPLAHDEIFWTHETHDEIYQRARDPRTRFLPLSEKWKKLASFDVVFCDFKWTFWSHKWLDNEVWRFEGLI